MRVSELMQNPEPYIGKEVTITGIVHRVRKKLQEWYLANDELQLLDTPPDERLVLKWVFVPSDANEGEKRELSEQLQQLILTNVRIGKARRISRFHTYRTFRRKGRIGSTTLVYGSISEHLDRQWWYSRHKHLAYVFENSDDSWKTIENPFIDPSIETQALDLYRKLTYNRPFLLFPELLSKTSRSLPYECWFESAITGILEQYEDHIILNNAWKAVVPTIESTAHVILKDQLDYLDNFNDSPSIPVMTVLQEPEKYYGQEITIRGLFTSDFVNFGDDIKYARIVPNRLYYEYRSKWDNRVSLHLKLSGVTGLLSSHDGPVPGEIKRLSSNRNCLDIRITGTLIPPENEHSSIILDNITDLVSIHDGLIQHWKSYRLYSSNWSWYSEEIREL